MGNDSELEARLDKFERATEWCHRRRRAIEALRRVMPKPPTKVEP